MPTIAIRPLLPAMIAWKALRKSHFLSLFNYRSGGHKAHPTALFGDYKARPSLIAMFNQKQNDGREY